MIRNLHRLFPVAIFGKPGFGTPVFNTDQGNFICHLFPAPHVHSSVTASQDQHEPVSIFPGLLFFLLHCSIVHNHHNHDCPGGINTHRSIQFIKYIHIIFHFISHIIYQVAGKKNKIRFSFMIFSTPFITAFLSVKLPEWISEI